MFQRSKLSDRHNQNNLSKATTDSQSSRKRLGFDSFEKNEDATYSKEEIIYQELLFRQRGINKKLLYVEGTWLQDSEKQTRGLKHKAAEYHIRSDQLAHNIDNPTSSCRILMSCFTRRIRKLRTSLLTYGFLTVALLILVGVFIKMMHQEYTTHTWLSTDGATSGHPSISQVTTGHKLPTLQSFSLTHWFRTKESRKHMTHEEEEGCIQRDTEETILMSRRKPKMEPNLFCSSEELQMHCIDRSIMALNAIRDMFFQHITNVRDPSWSISRPPRTLWYHVLGLPITKYQVKDSVDEILGSNSHQNHQEVSNTLERNERALYEAIDKRIMNLVNVEFRAFWESITKKVVEKCSALHNSCINGNAKIESATDSTRLSKAELQLIAEMIDEALDERLMDASIQPDYALYSAGGRIISELTSAEFQLSSSPTFWGRIGLAKLIPPPSQFEKSAKKAIRPEIEVGECWAMSGDHGQIGIQLARKIIVTGVTIEHVDPRVAFDLRSAPREIEIWGLPTPLDSIQQQLFKRKNINEILFGENDDLYVKIDNSDNSDTKSRRGKSSSITSATLLGIIEYKIEEDMMRQNPRNTDSEDNCAGDAIKRHRHRTKQTFSLPLSNQDTPTSGIVARIKSNWGHPEFTCLYRIRIHGRQVDER